MWWRCCWDRQVQERQSHVFRLAVHDTDICHEHAQTWLVITGLCVKKTRMQKVQLRQDVQRQIPERSENAPKLLINKVIGKSVLYIRTFLTCVFKYGLTFRCLRVYAYTAIPLDCGSVSGLTSCSRGTPARIALHSRFMQICSQTAVSGAAMLHHPTSLMPHGLVKAEIDCEGSFAFCGRILTCKKRKAEIWRPQRL